MTFCRLWRAGANRRSTRPRLLACLRILADEGGAAIVPAVVAGVAAAGLAAVTPPGVVVCGAAGMGAFVSAEVRPIVPGGVKAVRNPLAAAAPTGHRRSRDGAR